MRTLTIADPALLGGRQSPAAAFKAAALALSPAGMWMFDETSGTTAADSSGWGKNLTLTNGPVLTAGGPLGRYCEFDGSNDYAPGAGISFTGEWSAVACVRIDTMADRQIVGNWMTGNQRWIFALTSTGIEGYAWNSGYVGFGVATTLTGGSWAMVGMSRRTGSGNSSLYRAGVQLATGTIAAPIGGSTTEVGRKDGAANSIDGGICGVVVYDKALSTAQHLALAQAAGLA